MLLNRSASRARAIPTRVGKSIKNPFFHLISPGHPHAGGEIANRGNFSVVRLGPSPRGWGNPQQSEFRLTCDRAIPTRVGKSLARCRRLSRRAGHPHAGGEILIRDECEAILVGPSPRGWGNQFHEPVKKHRERAIPTRVGKSCRARIAARDFPGHPHAGGEIQSILGYKAYETGPSPRGWGNPPDILYWQASSRAIPTRVGKSGP